MRLSVVVETSCATVKSGAKTRLAMRKVVARKRNIDTLYIGN